MNESTTNGKATAEQVEKWPTARKVAATLGVSRQQVYRLERRGKLAARESRENGAKVRRYDPSTVAELEQAETELERLLAEMAEDSAGDEEEAAAAPALPTANGMLLAARALAESRQVATDARKGMHEAYDLIAKPTQEIVKLLMATVTQQNTRIADLEGQLNRIHDEQRDQRREDRESAFVQQRMQRDDDRKDAFFRMFVDHLPVVLEQMRPGGAKSQLFEYLKKCSPEKQARIIMAMETVIGDDPSPPATEVETPETAQKGEA